MQIGKFEIEQLSEGFFEIFRDSTFRKMSPQRLDKMRNETFHGKYSTAVGVDPLYITDGEKHILLDCGLGWGLDHGSRYHDTSNVVTNLAIFDVCPEDIDYVVLSHLHYDHAAGATYINTDFQTTATFPNAEYLVHDKEWAYAIDINRPETVNGIGYMLDEFYKLAAEKRLRFVSGKKNEIIPGVELLHTGGHTPGHQGVRISSQGNEAYYLGDLLPTEYHLNQYAMKQVDENPLQAKKIKTLMLSEAFKNGAYLFFYHSLFRKSGQLSRDTRKKYVLLDS